MRVAMIVNSFPEISEKFLLNQVIALVAEGIELDVYAAHKPISDERHDIFEKYGVSERVRYLNIPRNLRKRIPVMIQIFFWLLIRSPKIAFRSLNTKKYKTVARNGKNLWFAREFFYKKYDIIHCHFGPNGLIGSFLKDSDVAKALVVTFHGSDINTYPSRHGQMVYQWMYERVDLITVNTSFTGSKVITNGCSPEKIKILPVGLIPADYDQVNREFIEPFSILTVGRLVGKKGHEYLMRAFTEILIQFPTAQWYIAGSGHLKDSLESLSDTLGISLNVHFLGQCNNTRVKELYAKAAVFVLPSVTAPDGDMEGQGLVLQEAQYCRIPVVSTLHNGIPDGVIEGKTGYLVPEKDSAALVDRICSLFNDSKHAQMMGNYGHEFVSKNYDTYNLAQTLKEWYQKLS